MNQDMTDPEDDQTLRDAFDDYRAITPSDDLEAQCLAAAQRGLENADSNQPLHVKKMRSHAFKLPAAIAASLLVGFGSGWLMRDSTLQNIGAEHAATQPQPIFGLPAASVNATSAVDFDGASPERSYFVSETYLCGVGRIQSKSSYLVSGDQK